MAGEGNLTERNGYFLCRFGEFLFGEKWGLNVGIDKGASMIGVLLKVGLTSG